VVDCRVSSDKAGDDHREHGLFVKNYIELVLTRADGLARFAGGGAERLHAVVQFPFVRFS
jgi:hypothetical protein